MFLTNVTMSVSQVEKELFLYVHPQKNCEIKSISLISKYLIFSNFNLVSRDTDWNKIYNTKVKHNVGHNCEYKFKIEFDNSLNNEIDVSERCLDAAKSAYYEVFQEKDLVRGYCFYLNYFHAKLFQHPNDSITKMQVTTFLKEFSKITSNKLYFKSWLGSIITDKLFSQYLNTVLFLIRQYFYFMKIKTDLLNSDSKTSTAIVNDKSLITSIQKLTESFPSDSPLCLRLTLSLFNKISPDELGSIIEQFCTEKVVFKNGIYMEMICLFTKKEALCQIYRRFCKHIMTHITSFDQLKKTGLTKKHLDKSELSSELCSYGFTSIYFAMERPLLESSIVLVIEFIESVKNKLLTDAFRLIIEQAVREIICNYEKEFSTIKLSNIFDIINYDNVFTAESEYLQDIFHIVAKHENCTVQKFFFKMLAFEKSKNTKISPEIFESWFISCKDPDIFFDCIENNLFRCKASDIRNVFEIYLMKFFSKTLSQNQQNKFLNIVQSESLFYIAEQNCQTLFNIVVELSGKFILNLSKCKKFSEFTVSINTLQLYFQNNEEPKHVLEVIQFYKNLASDIKIQSLYEKKLIEMAALDLKHTEREIFVSLVLSDSLFLLKSDTTIKLFSTLVYSKHVKIRNLYARLQSDEKFKKNLSFDACKKFLDQSKDYPGYVLEFITSNLNIHIDVSIISLFENSMITLLQQDISSNFFEQVVHIVQSEQIFSADGTSFLSLVKTALTHRTLQIGSFLNSILNCNKFSTFTLSNDSLGFCLKKILPEVHSVTTENSSKILKDIVKNLIDVKQVSCVRNDHLQTKLIDDIVQKWLTEWDIILLLHAIIQISEAPYSISFIIDIVQNLIAVPETRKTVENEFTTLVCTVLQQSCNGFNK